jgi:hypothetical protein
MPTTRKRIARHAPPRIDPVSAFRWTTNGYAPHPLGLEVYANEREARAAWDTYRRDVWRVAHRMSVPATARLYDGLTMRGLERLHLTFTYIAGIDLAGALAGVEEDRQAIVHFERANPTGAFAIADFLAMWRADLDRIAHIAHQLHGDRYAGAYQQLGTALTYGGTPERETPA